MHGLEISAIFDLGGETDPKAEKVRDEIRSRLRDATYAFDHGSARVKPLLGDYVHMSFSRYESFSDSSWIAFEGLCTRVIEIKESGTDLFPAAGFYRADNTLPEEAQGASATVSWKMDHRYPLSEDVIDTVVRNAHSSSAFTENIRLEVPVACSRSWALTLTAPTFEGALKAYRLLRSGLWAPETTFVDVLPDNRKILLLRHVSEED